MGGAESAITSLLCALKPVIAVLLLTVATPVPALSAEVGPDGARCAVTGKLAVDAYLLVLAEFANGRTDSATTKAGRVADLITLHDGLGCDTGRLTKAVECLTARILDRAPSAPNLIAKDCMKEAGMPMR